MDPGWPDNDSTCGDSRRVLWNSSGPHHNCFLSLCLCKVGWFSLTQNIVYPITSNSAVDNFHTFPDSVAPWSGKLFAVGCCGYWSTVLAATRRKFYRIHKHHRNRTRPEIFYYQPVRIYPRLREHGWRIKQWPGPIKRVMYS